MDKQQRDTTINRLADMPVPSTSVQIIQDNYSIRVDRSAKDQYCVIKIYTQDHSKYNPLSSINGVWCYPKTAKGVLAAIMRFQKEEAL